MEMIIKSILDTDLYKLTMQNAIIQKFPNLIVEYTFKDRNNTVYPENFAEELQNQINIMSCLKLEKKEAFFLRHINFLPLPYIDFLRGYEFDPSEVTVNQDNEGHLSIKVKGPWYKTVLWEVPILALVSELFYIKTGQVIKDLHQFDHRDFLKIQKMMDHNAYFSEFGTRRRYSYENQSRVIEIFSHVISPCFVGTSNVHLAHKFNIKAIGTMAHEWIMAHGGLYGYRMANKMAMDNWSDVYGGNLGIALPDTYTTDVFLKSFDTKMSKLYDGGRQDSGIPKKFADKFIKHYVGLNIDPMSKAVIFSDSLNIDKAVDLKEYCVGKIKSSFGIGTHISNDVEVKPMNIVMKMSGVYIGDEIIPTIKLSDDIGKNMGFSEELELCKQTLKIS
jgi:nicotinate phosphoribosyltransferase